MVVMFPGSPDLIHLRPHCRSRSLACVTCCKHYALTATRNLREPAPCPLPTSIGWSCSSWSFPAVSDRLNLPLPPGPNCPDCLDHPNSHSDHNPTATSVQHPDSPVVSSDPATSLPSPPARLDRRMCATLGWQSDTFVDAPPHDQAHRGPASRILSLQSSSYALLARHTAHVRPHSRGGTRQTEDARGI